MGVTVTPTEYKSGTGQSEVVTVEWSAGQSISTVVVKSATDECQFAGGTAGTATSCGPPPGQSSQSGPSGSGPLPPIFLAGLAATSLAAVGRRD